MNRLTYCGQTSLHLAASVPLPKGTTKYVSPLSIGNGIPASLILAIYTENRQADECGKTQTNLRLLINYCENIQKQTKICIQLYFQT